MPATDRLSLPLLAVAQAQKEMTHNEALTIVDAMLQPVVLAETAIVPTSPVPGQAWIVGSGAAGAWTGQIGSLATWTAGGWRFVAPFEGLVVWDVSQAMPRRRSASAWLSGETRGNLLLHGGQQVVGAQYGTIAAATGGTIVDIESRATIASILAALRSHGLIAT